MTVAEAMKKMILFSNGNQHDINHFLKVHAYAATIGACEGLPEDTLQTLELAAIVHDIACPLCREKYGNTNGKYQELEGAPLTGYIRGGCSPIGMKKHFPTFIDESAQLFDTICVSAGKIGAQVELAPDALCKLVNAQYADLTD